MGRPSKHSPEVRERAVRMVFDHAARASVAVGGDSVGRREARDSHGIVAPLGAPGGARCRQRPGLTTDEREELKRLQREVVELKRANEILRKASAFFAQAELDRRAK